MNVHITRYNKAWSLRDLHRYISCKTCCTVSSLGASNTKQNSYYILVLWTASLDLRMLPTVREPNKSNKHTHVYADINGTLLVNVTFYLILTAKCSSSKITDTHTHTYTHTHRGHPHRLPSSLRTDSTDFTTGPFLLSISVLCF